MLSSRHRSRLLMTVLPAAIVVSLFVSSIAEQLGGADCKQELEEVVDKPVDDDEAVETSWRVLFNGESLDGWSSTEFGGEGRVRLENEQIILEQGVTLTGINFDDAFPTSNYEFSLEATALDGIDFFCGVTFPVGESHCSFIVGGWAGTIVGLSSIDGMDASENETTKIMTFEKEQFYTIRVRVTDETIECWIDEEQVVDQSIVGRRIGLRPEVYPSRPFGIASFQTKAAIKNIRLRELAE